MSKFNRFLRSKAGMATIGGVLVLILAVAVVGWQLGWFETTPGTVLPPETFPAPPNGYTCLPSCVASKTENDGKFFSLVGADYQSFTDKPIVVYIGVPSDYEKFTIEIFDGDSGKDNNGNLNVKGGNWDEVTADTTYKLFADPIKTGAGEKLLGTWTGNGNNMPNNDWYTITQENVPEAQAETGHYFYRFEASRAPTGAGITVFKLRSNGYLSTDGRTEFAVVGAIKTASDISLLYPQFVSLDNQGPSSYTGTWDFYTYLPDYAKTLTFWDGDFDRGTTPSVSDEDSDDPNTTPNIEKWMGSGVKPEGAKLQGNPPDDFNFNKYYKRSPTVFYKLLAPDNSTIFENQNPSGNQEWEQYIISSDPSANPDVTATADLQDGFYNLHIEGLDLHNTAFLRLPVCDPVAGCGPTTWREGMCPRTIGYWKNNINKIYVQNKTNGVQETKAGLDEALRYVALASPLFRHGINVAAPVPITDPTPLTPQEADMILQRSDKGPNPYPADADRNSMMARALQQNLATWLNLASGKIGPTTVVSIAVPDAQGGAFNGTLWEALQEGQSLILSNQNLERAKDIADLINNRQITTDTTVVNDVTCPAAGDSDAKLPIPTENQNQIPPDKQPKRYTHADKANKPEDPPNPTVEPPSDPATCGVLSNQYDVSITSPDNPFYGIKYDYKSGTTEIKGTLADEYKFTLTADQAASMTSMQMQAKAGEQIGTVTLDNCDFTANIQCGPLFTDDGVFGFTFVGAQPNADGTLTLTFMVQNTGEFGISHVVFGLPDGIVPATPTNTYQSQVCPK